MAIEDLPEALQNVAQEDPLRLFNVMLKTRTKSEPGINGSAFKFDGEVYSVCQIINKWFKEDGRDSRNFTLCGLLVHFLEENPGATTNIESYGDFLCYILLRYAPDNLFRAFVKDVKEDKDKPKRLKDILSKCDKYGKIGLGDSSVESILNDILSNVLVSRENAAYRLNFFKTILGEERFKKVVSSILENRWRDAIKGAVSAAAGFEWVSSSLYSGAVGWVDPVDNWDAYLSNLSCDPSFVALAHIYIYKLSENKRRSIAKIIRSYDEDLYGVLDFVQLVLECSELSTERLGGLEQLLEAVKQGKPRGAVLETNSNASVVFTGVSGRSREPVADDETQDSTDMYSVDTDDEVQDFLNADSVDTDDEEAQIFNNAFGVPVEQEFTEGDIVTMLAPDMVPAFMRRDEAAQNDEAQALGDAMSDDGTRTTRGSRRSRSMR